ncbi:DUF1127 domain-containing protein [Pararhodobacter sp. SW119]|uniref:DUF1127 domain-containing protein n=1 Tax=Pararhodobacter sp. SW119 TaxID=2780075 RepID=UPI001ADF0FFD|nr:DUF1127 domain-containing protein [Pararhodobacter sp. SW119]
MAYFPNLNTEELTPRLRAQADRFFATLGQGFNSYIERRSRRAQIEYLDSLSDAELAKRGITRDQIVQHVFRDLMFC